MCNSKGKKSQKKKTIVHFITVQNKCLNFCCKPLKKKNEITGVIRRYRRVNMQNNKIDGWKL